MLSWSVGYYVSEWVIRLVMLVVVPRRRAAAASRGGLLLIFLLPWPGLIVYALIGRPNLPHRRVALQARISEVIRAEQAGRFAPDAAGLPVLPPEFTHVVPLAQRLGDFQIVQGNRVELI